MTPNRIGCREFISSSSILYVALTFWLRTTRRTTCEKLLTTNINREEKKEHISGNLNAFDTSPSALNLFSWVFLRCADVLNLLAWKRWIFVSETWFSDSSLSSFLDRKLCMSSSKQSTQSSTSNYVICEVRSKHNTSKSIHWALPERCSYYLFGWGVMINKLWQFTRTQIFLPVLQTSNGNCQAQIERALSFTWALQAARAIPREK